MLHTRYLNSRETVCQRPDKLETYEEAVVQDPTTGQSNEKSCKICYSLIFAHNEREFKKEQEAKLEPIVRFDEQRYRRNAILLAFSISLAIWLVAFLVVWVVW